MKQDLATTVASPLSGAQGKVNPAPLLLFFVIVGVAIFFLILQGGKVKEKDKSIQNIVNEVSDVQQLADLANIKAGKALDATTRLQQHDQQQDDTDSQLLGEILKVQQPQPGGTNAQPQWNAYCTEQLEGEFITFKCRGYP